jgi:co-chaperonin GroES (HSP10)
MATNLTAIKGNVRAVGDRVLVTDMYFGEQTTKGGIILANDDGKTRGIYPRWGKVHSKGPKNKDPYDIGDWILIEHGRWTRAMKLETEAGEELEVRMVETESILAYADERPEEAQIGKEFADGEAATIDPSSFVRT